MWNGIDYYDKAIDTYTHIDKNRVLQTFFRSHYISAEYGIWNFAICIKEMMHDNYISDRQLITYSCCKMQLINFMVYFLSDFAPVKIIIILYSC
jgi:hypothetical protein